VEDTDASCTETKAQRKRSYSGISHFSNFSTLSYRLIQKRQAYIFYFLFAFSIVVLLLCSACKQGRHSIVEKKHIKKKRKKKKEVRYQTEVKLNEAQQRQWLYWPSDNCRSALMS